MCYCSKRILVPRNCYHSLSNNAEINPVSLNLVRDVLWAQLTTRGRQHFMLQLRGVAWTFAGLCCREQDVGCFMRRTTAASDHWTSAERGKHLGESCLLRNQLKTPNSREVRKIIPLVSHRELVCLFFFFSSGPSCWLINCYTMISSVDISNSPSYWINTWMNQATTSPESQGVSISPTIHLVIKSELMVMVRLVLYFVLFFSSLLLDTVFPNSEWSCHPADSGHVGGLWRNHLLFAFPLAGQKHLLTVPPHDHIPEVQTIFLCRKPQEFIVCILKSLLPSFQVTKPDLPGNPNSWFVPFSALLLWETRA